MKRARFEPRLAAFAVTLLILLAAATRPVAAGQEPRVLTVGEYPITIEYMPSDERVMKRVVEICVAAIPGIRDELGLDRVYPIRIALVPDMDVYRAETPLRLPSWGIAFALMEHQIMLVDVKRAANAWNRLETVIPHELSHLLVAQRVGEIRMPIWFAEGLAMWQAREWSMLESWRLMESVWGQRAPHLASIVDALPANEAGAHDAYRVAYTAFTTRFDGQWDALPRFLDEVVRDGDFAQAFSGFWGETEGQYYARFTDELYHKYRSRLLLFQSGPLFTIVAVLFLFVFLKIRVRNQRRLKRMEQSERGLAHDDF